MIRKNELKSIGNLKETNGGYVYVLLADDNTVKIGVTVNPFKRVSQIETASGKEIIDWTLSKPCSNYLEIEKELHDHFSKSRLKGEWFNIEYPEAKELLNKFKLEDIQPQNLKDRISMEMKSLELAKEIMMEFKYKEFNYDKLKYDFKNNVSKDDIDEIVCMIKENREYNKSEGENYNHLDVYLNKIESGDILNPIREYCVEYLDLLGDENILIDVGIYDLFDRILGFRYEKCNYIADEYYNKKIKEIIEEFGEETINSLHNK